MPGMNTWHGLQEGHGQLQDPQGSVARHVSSVSPEGQETGRLRQGGMWEDPHFKHSLFPETRSITTIYTSLSLTLTQCQVSPAAA